MRTCKYLAFGFVVLAIAIQASPKTTNAQTITRILPPEGLKLPPGKRAELADELSKLEKRIQRFESHPLAPDIEIFVKAVSYALRHGEFYNEKDINKDVAKAVLALQRANERLDQLSAGKTPWTEQRGILVRGFRSQVDGSPQPYGLVIPEKLDLSKPVPLYIWLHGRGDKATDLHFIHERQSSVGQISPPNAIVIHPLGRQCVGFKSAGETDVLEAVAHVQSQYPIDPNRIVMMGFSMGGAGAWHLGAHYADRWVAISPGAGFAETAQYNKLDTQNYQPYYEQVLWGNYDVPNYVRNLFNRPVIAYSGEKDKQIQAARIMEAAYVEHGQTLQHLIGPNTEHKYHPETLKQLLLLIDEQVQKGLNRAPAKVSLQTRTLRYSKMFWVELLGLEEHWRDSRVDAEVIAAQTIVVTTKNATRLRLSPPSSATSGTIVIDNQKVSFARDSANAAIELKKTDNTWTLMSSAEDTVLRKRPGLQGPIDDAFLESFLVVVPTEKSNREAVEKWVSQERERFFTRWRALMRGDARVKRDTEVTADDIARHHLVLWGDPESNQVIRRINGLLPVNWPNGSVQVEDRRFRADQHVPALIYPNPLNPKKYVVVNSGLTFREAHDRTNSQQNPKLPDWAVIDITQPPDANSPGRIVAAGFFDENWQVKSSQ